MKPNDPDKLEEKLLKEASRKPGRFRKYQKRAKQQLIDLQDKDHPRSPQPERN